MDICYCHLYVDVKVQMICVSKERYFTSAGCETTTYNNAIVIHGKHARLDREF